MSLTMDVKKPVVILGGGTGRSVTADRSAIDGQCGARVRMMAFPVWITAERTGSVPQALVKVAMTI
jgi:hypothetical protein